MSLSKNTSAILFYMFLLASLTVFSACTPVYVPNGPKAVVYYNLDISDKNIAQIIYGYTQRLDRLSDMERASEAVRESKPNAADIPELIDVSVDGMVNDVFMLPWKESEGQFHADDSLQFILTKAWAGMDARKTFRCVVAMKLSIFKKQKLVKEAVFKADKPMDAVNKTENDAVNAAVRKIIEDTGHYLLNYTF